MAVKMKLLSVLLGKQYIEALTAFREERSMPQVDTNLMVMLKI